MSGETQIYTRGPYKRKVTSCSVPGCESGGRFTRGLCKRHYARLLRHGDTGSAEMQHASPITNETCSVDGCGNRVRSKGLCCAHYHRLRKYGTPTGKPRRASEEDRFLSYVDMTSHCWEWTGGLMSGGYGMFHLSDTTCELAHRYAYQRFVEPIPEGLVIDHLCRNRKCVNPDHLEVVTNLENLRRGIGYRLQNGMDDRCIHGHKYTVDNTYISPKGKILCRTCQRIAQAKREGNAS
ncbi:HNH endonuclease signature motif containing protein [Cutibacterium avidum]|uniref:HNH endonuclease signature motif containing protein n=2 Tax=Cutibacterium avidum TaxID=33010 RepID=UPI000A8BFF88|nr:MAG TPA: homing endonuclease [Caudoviricetes sp.]